jgi:hypothetical protein
MASYLESYGAIEERKARNRKLLKRGLIALVCAIILGLFLYALFHNYSEEQTAKTFLQELRNHEYQQAYRMWGCTEQTPCRDYAFSKFMEDWGPNSAHANEANTKIGMSQSCGDGVLLRIDYAKAQPVLLIVDRATHTLSFAPSDWVECPGRHWHFGTFLRRLFRS